MRRTIQVVTTSSPEETAALGRELAARLRAPALVLLSGDLGAGKTTLVKGLASGLGLAEAEEVTSPSFVFVHVYGSRPRLYHVDLYRVEGVADLESLGLEDLMAEEAIVVVEWAERLKLPALRPAMRIQIEAVSDVERRIRVEGGNDD
ncbi:MAG TPA: tRNA (adenosine(37)-N6)-threonylcarbamoyltransferase complex ATPase subunit type 1 TsaE [Candidatus Xenobia bacterium]|nr:tRNA (adenosine(37)-N6)-threonylcarbamoyltransferase complex ATPase subunit type 1 TsaE [Candidatus Xenobia bacterium]